MIRHNHISHNIIEISIQPIYSFCETVSTSFMPKAAFAMSGIKQALLNGPYQLMIPQPCCSVPGLRIKHFKCPLNACQLGCPRRREGIIQFECNEICLIILNPMREVDALTCLELFFSIEIDISSSHNCVTF